MTRQQTRKAIYESDKGWSDRFIEEVKIKLAPFLFNEASFYEDANHCTDLMTYESRPLRIAVRIRRNKYMAFKDEITIRCGRMTNVMTEAEKIASGWGDLMIYGFCDATETCLALWHIIDLTEFRRWFLRNWFRIDKCRVQTNADGTQFFAIKIMELPADAIVAKGVAA